MTATATGGDLRYPVGTFAFAPPTAEVRRQAIDDIADLPHRMRTAVAGLTEAQLDTPYRPGGWTVRQVVHHVADSHLNGFTRTKLALTEERPRVTPYDEKAFATLPDMRLAVACSLGILDGIHMRWAEVFRSLRPEQFALVFLHPEYPDPQTLDRQVQHYAWHCRHHVAHITALRAREGW
jgi:hypothetical protein